MRTTHITQTTATLSWATGGASNWNIEWDTTGFALGNGIRIRTATNPHTLTALAPGTDYDFYVRDSCDSNNLSTWASPYTFRTLCSSPSSLLAIRITQITQTTVTLSWATGGASNWNIEWDTTGFALGSGTFVYNVPNPYTLTGLTPGTTYDFYIRDSCGSNNLSTWAGPYNFNTLSCPEPSSLRAIHITQTTATLSWATGGAFNWNIEWDTTGFALGNGIRIRTATNPHTLTALTPGTDYDFYVRDSCGSNNLSTWAGLQNFRTFSCPSPTVLTLDSIAQTSAKLSWITGGASNWDVEYGIQGFIPGSGTFVYNVSNPYTLSGLTPGTDYDFYVRDSCGSNNLSTWAGLQNFRTLSCPSPTVLTLDSIAQTIAKLSWITGGASNWDVEWDTTGFAPGSGTFVYNVPNPYTLTGLTPGTTYDFYVRDSCGSNNLSTWAGLQNFRTLSCPSPTVLTLDSIAQTIAKLSWITGGASNWDVEYGIQGFIPGSGTFVYNVSNPYTLSGLTPGTDYDFYVRDSCGSNNLSTWAGLQNFRTFSCPSPTVLTLDSIAQTSAKLSWITGGASNWDVEYGIQGFIPGSGTFVYNVSNPYTLSGLTPGTDYDFYVRDSCGSNNLSTWAGLQNFRTLSCPSPTVLTLDSIAQTIAKLSWITGGASNWDVEWDTTGFAPGSGTFVYNVPNPYTLTGLTPGTTYDFYVRDSCGSNNLSTWAGLQNFRTLSCPSPTVLTLDSIAQTSAKLSWITGGASNWDVEYGIQGFIPGSGTFVYNVSNPYTLSALTPGTDYDFYVRDSCGSNNLSTWAGLQNFRTLSCPSPTVLTLDSIAQTTAKLSWITGGASNWDVEYGIQGFIPGSGTFVYNVSNPYTLSGLTPGTDYDFYVRDSCGSNNLSTWAGLQNFRTLSCPSPTVLTLDSIAQTSAKLSWITGGASNWDVEYGIQGFIPGSGTFVYNVSNPYTLSGLTPGTDYDFYVRDSCGSNNLSTWAGLQNFRTLSCPSPTVLTLDSIAQTSAKLSWITGGASNWDVEYGIQGFIPGSGTFVYNVSNPYTLSGLTPGTDYDFYVRDSCGSNNLSTWAGLQNFRTLSCPSPTVLTLDSIAQTTAKLSWITGGASNWNIEWDTTGFALGNGIRIRTATNPHTLTALTPGTDYDFYVRDSCGSNNLSTWAGLQNFRTLSCPSPTVLTLDSIAQTSAKLSWITGGASNWDVEYGIQGFIPGSGIFVYNVSNPYTLSGLTPGTDYDFYVRDSCGSNNLSTWAGLQNFRTLSCPSSTGLTLDSIAQTTATLSWATGGASNWNIEWDTTGFALGNGIRIRTATNPHTLTALTPGTDYDFYVRDSCGSNNLSTWAGLQNFRTLSCPSPTVLTLDSIAQTSAKLSWITGGASNWDVEYGIQGFIPGSGIFVYNVSNPYTLSGLTPGTDYDFYVRDSCGSNNLSTWAGLQNFRTLSCPSSTGLTLDSIAQTSAKLSWITGGASNWDVEYGIQGFIPGSGTFVYNVSNPYTLSDLTPGTDYDFYVRDSCGSNNLSTWVGLQNFRTLSCPSPTGLTLDSIAQTTAKLSWITGGASNWDVEYGIQGFIPGSGTFVYNVSNPYTLSGLTPGTDYDFYVRDSCGSNNLSTWAGLQNFRTLSCPSPTGLTLDSIAQTSAKLSWITGGASNWDVEYGIQGFIPGSGTFVYNVPNPYTLTGLTPGTTYDFYVRDSCGSNNLSTWVGLQNFRTLSCPSPTGLTLDSIAQTTAKLSWITGGASNWDVEYGIQGFIPGSGTFVYNVSNPYTLSGLTPGTDYDFYVRDSCGSNNLSTWAGLQNFRTLSCPSPTGLTLDSIAQTSAKLSWITGGASNWDVEYGIQGFIPGSGTFVYNVPNPYTLTGLTPGTTYDFYVRDSCGSNNLSTWAGLQNFRTLSCPSPTGLTLDSIAQTTATLSWATGGASNWNIEWDTTGFALGNGIRIRTATNPHTLTALTPGTDYDFYVRDSCGSNNLSTWAGLQNFRTLSCLSPTGLTLDSIAQTSAKLSWITGGASNWDVEYGIQGFIPGSGTFVYNVSNPYTLSGLTPGTDYDFYVRDSCGSNNLSTWVGLQNFRTLSCPSPTGLTLDSIAQTSAKLSWIMGGASNWDVEYGIQGFIPGSGTFVYNVSNPYTLSGLTPGTDYDFYVRDSCGSNNLSTWAGPYNFNTLSCPEPFSLRATHITQTTATLSWATGGASNWNMEYGIQGFTPGSGTFVYNVPNPYTLSGLTPGTDYDFYVRDSCGSNNLSTWVGLQNFRTLSCPSPTGLTLDSIAQTSAKLSWITGGASNWDVEYGIQGFIPGSGTFVYNVSNPYTLSGLTPGTDYDFYVRDSCGSNNLSTWAGPYNFNTISCPTPSSLLAINITQTTATLSWATGGASNWVLEYGLRSFTPRSGAFVYNVSNPYTLTALTSGTTYDFYVRDSCGSGNLSTWAGPYNFNTISCPAPSSLRASPITQNTVTLSWARGGAFNWVLEYGLRGFTLGNGIRVRTATNPHTLTGLTPGTTYDFYVRDSCGSGNLSTWAGPYNFNTISCPAPSSLLATHITQNTATLSWITGGASNWVLEYGLRGFTPRSGTFVYNVSNPYTLTGLTSGTIYDFYVRDSCGSNNLSTWAGPYNFNTISCPTPSSLLATPITQNTATLSWARGGASNWVLEYGLRGFAPGSGAFVYNVSNPYTLTGLTSGTTYDFYVRDSCGSNNLSTWVGPQNFRTLSCPSPTGLTLDSIAQTSAKLSWITGGASNWDVEYGIQGFIPGSGTFVYNVSNPYTLSGLTPGTTYDFYVRDSCDSNNLSTWAGPYTFRTLSCSSPSSLLATRITQNTATLSWATGGASNWNIERDTTGFALGNGIRIRTATNPHTLTALTPGTDYDFYVRDSCGSNNLSTWAGPYTFRTLSCSSPSSLLATRITQNTATLSWATGGASNWNIEWDTTGFALGNGIRIRTATNPHTLTALAPGTDYDFYVRDSCGSNNLSTWAGPYTFRTLSCSSPSSLLATRITQNTATLSWATGGASNWNIEWDTTGFALGNGIRIRTATNPHTLTALTLGTDYDFYVRDSCGVGHVSSWAGPDAFTTLSATLPCPSPSSLGASNITQTSARLSWMSGGTFTSSWDLEYGLSGFTLGSGTQISTTTPSYTVSGLTPGTDYDFYVRDSCGVGHVSSWAGPDAFTTLSATLPCPSPSSLGASNITQTSATLSWVTGGASNWNIEYGPINFPLGSGIFLYNVSSPRTLRGLKPNTFYDVYVQDSCNVGNVSNWTGPLSVKTIIGIDELLERSFRIYPNPSEGVFKLEFSSSLGEDMEIRITNMMGQIILEDEIESFSGSYRKRLEMGAYRSGVYLLQLITERATVNRRIILQ